MRKHHGKTFHCSLTSKHSEAADAILSQFKSHPVFQTQHQDEIESTLDLTYSEACVSRIAAVLCEQYLAGRELILMLKVGEQSVEFRGCKRKTLQEMEFALTTVLNTLFSAHIVLQKRQRESMVSQVS